ncbi:exodeoxyribonuclease I [Bathymodiolus platifrons methanotrophic gill symbiont]|uniref:exodeoxyribonuclease I n=1 Tax=Bathymodiolus platifrons methanotrophic gill symbiont TaxID=113268 RepID=UPI000B416A8B|nr:exodeoxyribonuclease I [Bathymodiolus platifrons methanotrophic gill symbiont]MCK5871100.1 exodeoxyribonuclease I [Methyloprofundus sp.]TXK99455.1 exodeoxyribonuclease I [Methylococcaceae bacterium CS4]TXL00789.1 exodeoxyribonuclease I [Methylococcaceae bacterium CS5]TXL08841.1 exodeoxyribonuclease I [Methylococcaceae bacterium CS1]TXL08994.1 exodeoxyribonuclease I [Methylococcaceae bacterium CS3]TXL11004.1 exodeoxyribonuclease I [Methylococcaceae bacterium CS2]TXL15037.1 exodeoxyribonucl
MTENSFYWHDYETFGVDPQRDRAVQFAGIRTDFDFNILGEPLVIYCRPADDTLPQPEACCVTGITPQKAAEKGVCETEFIAQIHKEMAQENTCTLGYNNLRFDDEVTRNLLYRNFYDPYAREWQQGNSRWDLIDLIRTVHALRPEGIQWPTDNEGRISFRLEKLTAENGIEHAAAHDALSDVYATIALAKLINQAQPKLFQFFLLNRGKHQIKQLLQLGTYIPVVHVSGMYGAEKQYIALVVPICQHPVNTNGVIVYDLSVNPEVMLKLSAEEIQQRIFTPKADLPEGVERIPLKTIHINKCPIVAPVKVLRANDAERLGIDIEQCQNHSSLIQQSGDLIARLNKIFSGHTFSSDSELNPDPDLMIYSGGFFSAQDKQMMAQIHALEPEQLADFVFKGGDSRLSEMLFRYRARNYPETLNNEESMRWQQFCMTRLSDSADNGFLDFDSYQQKINELKQKPDVDSQLLNDLEQYAIDLQKKLNA